jgi:hypothetical protein
MEYLADNVVGGDALQGGNEADTACIAFLDDLIKVGNVGLLPGSGGDDGIGAGERGRLAAAGLVAEHRVRLQGAKRLDASEGLQ